MQGWGGIIFLDSDNTGSQKEENFGFLKKAEVKIRIGVESKLRLANLAKRAKSC